MVISKFCFFLVLCAIIDLHQSADSVKPLLARGRIPAELFDTRIHCRLSGWVIRCPYLLVLLSGIPCFNIAGWLFIARCC